MATDASILNDLDTATAAVSAIGSAQGGYRIQGYDPIRDKIFFTDAAGQLYSVDTDGTNIAYIGANSTLAEFNSGLDVTPRGWIEDNRLWVVGVSAACKIIDLDTAGGVTVFTSGDIGSSRDGVKTVYDGNAGVNGRLWWGDENEGIKMWDFADADHTIIHNGNDNTYDTAIAVNGTRVNSDAKVGLVWYAKAGSTTLRTFAGDTASVTPYATVNLATGWPGNGITGIVDMRYDRENEVIYLLIETGTSPACEVWVMDMDETPDVNTAFLVRSVDDEAQAWLASLVLLYDSYDAAAAGIAELEPDLWLDAADALDAGAATPSNGGAVDSWPNKGSGADPTAVTSCTYETSNVNLNNLPAVVFDGTDDFIQLADGTVEWPATIFVVMIKDPDSADGYVLWTGERLGTGQTFSPFIGGGADVEWFNESDDTIRDIFPTAVVDESGSVASILMIADRTITDWTVVGQYEDANGKEGILQADSGAPVPITADMNTPQLIGARPNDTLPTIARELHARVAEYIVFNRQMTWTEYNVVWEELKTKYAL